MPSKLTSPLLNLQQAFYPRLGRASLRTLCRRTASHDGSPQTDVVARRGKPFGCSFFIAVAVLARAAESRRRLVPSQLLAAPYNSAQAAQLPFRSVPNPCPRFPDADRAEENSRIPRCALFLLQVQPTRWVDCIHVILSLCSPSLNLSRPPMRRQATSTNGGRPRHYHSLWVAREGLPHCGPVKTTLVGIPSYAADPVSSCVAALDSSSDSSNIARFHVIAQPATIRIAERMATSSPPMKTTDSSCIPSYRSMSALGTRVCRYRRTSRVLGVSPIPALSPVPSLLASSSC